MKEKLVTIIMSEFNTDVEILKESISSILNQTYKNIEFIIVDDCGKNDVKSIVEKFNDPRIIVIKNDKNLGLVKSLNKAINASHGELIARMDTDDYSYPNRIETEVDFLINNPKIDLVASRADLYDGEKIWGETKDFGKITNEKIISGNPLIHPSVMYKKEIIQKIGGYLDFNRCEDYATWIELFVNEFQMYVINEKLIRYHLSLEDYKKRTLKTRKGFFKMLKEEYVKLHPSRIQLIKMYVKTFISGILPWKLLFAYHKRRYLLDEK